MLPEVQDYSIQELVAEGRHTLVYRAVNKKTSKSAIIKIVKPQETHNLKSSQLLNNEYNLLTRLQSNRVIQAYEQLNVQNQIILALEDFPGISLAKALETETFSLKEKLEIAIQIAQGLGEIHQAHIIHKDIKPQNILINPETKQIKIIDFGIATQLSKEIPFILNPEQIAGSLAYMSPEQTGRVNAPIDYRSDIYSLGVTLYHLFTNRLPFIAETPLELIHLHIAQEPIPPHTFDHSIPPVISDIILKCLSKEVDRRYRSAFGLKIDLVHCLDFLKDGKIEPFAPGEEDLFDHFHFPEKLYDRHRELQVVEEIFNEVLGGAKCLLTLGGYSGVGKTSLVKEAQKKLGSKGRFVSARFDQFKRNIPYSGIAQAVYALIEQVLLKTDEELIQWKSNILKALGQNAQVIVEVVPEIQKIIGLQPPSEPLSPQENENRFRYTCTNFLKAVLRQEQFLVFFLDDMQWADEASLLLIEHIFQDAELSHFLLIGNYRDNEVTPLHPLSISLKEIGKQTGVHKHLTIQPLGFEAINEMIHEEFKGDPQEMQKLAELIYKRTHGNPFFAIQLLKHLYEQELLFFDIQHLKWRAKLKEIEKVEISDNVLELMINRLRKLDQEVSIMLESGSVVGHQFQADFLAKVCEKSVEKAEELLGIALQEDLITQEIYSQGILIKKPPEKHNFIFKFVHDRIQQAAYGLLSEDLRNTLHFKIGKVLVATLGKGKLKEKVIEIVNHFNQAPEELFTREEKENLIHLNCMAGLKAKDSIAYTTALQYFKKAISLLPEEKWVTHYDLSLLLHKNLALCLQITGEGIQQAEQHFEECLKKAKTKVEQLEIYYQIILLYSQKQEYERVFESAQKALRLSGENYELNPSKLSIMLELFKMKGKMAFRSIKELESLPKVKDPNSMLILKCLTALLYPSFVTGRSRLFVKSALKLCELSLKYGISKYSGAGFVAYSMVLGSELLRQYEKSADYGEAAIRMTAPYPNTLETGSTMYVYYSFSHRWRHPLKTCIAPLQQSYRICLANGAVNYAAASAVYVNLFLLVSGEPLEKVLVSLNDNLNEIRKLHSISEELSMIVYEQFCKALMGSTSDPKRLDCEGIGSIVLTPSNITQNLLHVLRFHIWQLVLFYLFGEYDQAKEEAEKIIIHKDNYPNWVEWHVFYFYYALILAAEMKKPSDDPVGWKTIKEIHKKFVRWGNASPHNYLHHELLIRAEIARIEGKKGGRTKIYEEAIAEAKKHGAPQDVAIAYETFAKYCSERGRKEQATVFYHWSLQYFTAWGAKAKCDHFKVSQVDYLALQPLFLHQPTKEESSFLTTFHLDKIGVSESLMTSGEELDVKGLIEASQSLSEEIVLDKLIESMMKIVMLHAGADKAFLIFIKDGQPLIYSEGIFQERYIPYLNPVPVSERGKELCEAAIKYVLRSHEILLLDNAMHDDNFKEDHYIVDHKIKSLLCIPLVRKGEVHGCLYLENHSATGAFSQKRNQLLSLLSSQMAICYENAQFYARLEEKVQSRTKQLQERNKELQQALQTIKTVQGQIIEQEKLASLGLLTSGIAHELKNPLNFVINFTVIVSEFMDEWEAGKGGILTDEEKEWLENVRNSLEKIETHGRRADSIIKSMLLHAQQGTGKKEKIDINSLVEQALTLTYQTYRKKYSKFNLKIDEEYEKEAMNVEGYPGEIIRVFVNIVDNACYALAEKVQANPQAFIPKLSIKTKKEGKEVVIYFRDNGPGIPQAILDKVFQPFFTTKPTGAGTGLGLSMAYDIITKQHQGRLIVKSEPNLYTEFEIRLPIIS